MNYVIAYDLGTGGIKASLVSENGSIASSHFVPYLTYFPCNNWQEQSPEDWWEAVKESTAKLLSIATIDASQIKSLAISGHSLGVVPIAKDGKLLRKKTPIWSDQRPAKQVEDFFTETNYEAWYMKTGCGFPPACYSIFKIMWYRDNEPEMYEQIDKVIGTKDYCNYRFTGRLCTDYSYASGSGVYDLHKWEYDNALIAASRVKTSIFPELLDSDAIVGKITKQAALETGLSEETLVVCGGVDNSCMALGAKGNRVGRTYTSLGSSSWVALIDSRPTLNFEYKPYVFAHVLKGLYTSATCIFSAGSSLQWVRNNMFYDLVEAEKRGEITSAYDEISKLAAQSPAGSNGLIFNPSLAGGSSLEPSPSICGAFVGLQLKHCRQDMARATMEGIALNLKFALNVFLADCPDINEMLIVGGGAKSNFWMQMFSSVYNLDIIKTEIDQMAATVGAAALAFNGVGIWEDYSTIDLLHKNEIRYSANVEDAEQYEELLKRFVKVANLISTIN